MIIISREFKYVILKSKRPVLLSPLLNHSDVVGPNVVAESAGSGKIFEDNGKLTVSCYGESITLKIKSRQEIDEDIIEKFLNEK